MVTFVKCIRCCRNSFAALEPPISCGRAARHTRAVKQLVAIIELCTIANGTIAGGRIDRTDARNAQQYLAQRMLMGHFR